MVQNVKRLKVFISHSSDDAELVREILPPTDRLPIDCHDAMKIRSAGRIQEKVKPLLDDVDVLIPFLTSNSVDSVWVQQEIGFAVAEGATLLPVYEDRSYLKAFLSDMEGVEIDRDRFERSTYELIGSIRSEVSTTGLFEPDWFSYWTCRGRDCTEEVVMNLEDEQSTLWKMHTSGGVPDIQCDSCGTKHFVDPATLRMIDIHRGE